MAHDVFISHSTKDDAVANKILKALEDSGVSCWVDHRFGAIRTGFNYPSVDFSKKTLILASLIFSPPYMYTPQMISKLEHKHYELTVKISINDDLVGLGFSQNIVYLHLAIVIDKIYSDSIVDLKFYIDI